MVVAAAIIALVYGTILCGYIQSGLRAQWSGYSLAAQSLSIEQIQQARSAMWDPAIGKNEVTNLNLTSLSYTSSNKTWSGFTTAILDVPYASTNFVIATNYVTVQMISLNNQTNPLIQMQMIRCDTVWPFFYRSLNTYFTNTTATLIGPDNRDPNAL